MTAIPQHLADNRQNAAKIFAELGKLYPNAHCELDFRTPYQLMVAAILSAQCTDTRVNLVTPALFRKFPTPQKMAAASPNDIRTLIKSVTFFNNKTKSIHKNAKMVMEKYNGRVPQTLFELVHLPGLGRKTANVVLGDGFSKAEGIVVDTHVIRLSQRLGLTKNKDAVKIERDLMPLCPQKDWPQVSHRLIWHGRRMCTARKPACEKCPLLKKNLCPSGPYFFTQSRVTKK